MSETKEFLSAWRRMEERSAAEAKERAEMKAEGSYWAYEYRDLPKDKWRVCSVCGGKGSYLEQEDCHRSEGWVPCTHCINGVVKREYVKVKCWTKRPYYG